MQDAGIGTLILRSRKPEARVASLHGAQGLEYSTMHGLLFYRWLRPTIGHEDWNIATCISARLDTGYAHMGRGIGTVV